MTEPADERDDLAHEAARGRSQKTPALAFGGVIGAVAVAVAVFAAILFALYFLL